MRYIQDEMQCGKHEAKLIFRYIITTVWSKNRGVWFSIFVLECHFCVCICVYEISNVLVVALVLHLSDYRFRLNEIKFIWNNIVSADFWTSISFLRGTDFWIDKTLFVNVIYKTTNIDYMNYIIMYLTHTILFCYFLFCFRLWFGIVQIRNAKSRPLYWPTHHV